MKVPFLDLGQAVAETREELRAAFERVMDSGWFLLGPELDAFEQEFARVCGTRYAIGVGSGLDALVLSLQAAGVGPGDEVIVPANTFIATFLAVSQTGAAPVPVDVNPMTGNLDAELVERAITGRTVAIVPVHLYGHPADMDSLGRIAEEHGLFVLEDAAQAHLARYRSRPVGSLGNAAAFSFYPGKNLGAFGDGGAIATDDEELADQIRMLRNYGSRRKYVHELRGTNSRLDELQAAFLSVRLKHLPAWNQRRERIAQAYMQHLAVVDGIQVPRLADGSTSSWHLFPVWIDSRDLVRDALMERGVEVLIHYPTPPHLSPAYSDLAKLELPVATEIARRTLSIPIGPHMSDDAVAWVTDSVTSVIQTTS